jgi:Zn-finger nucleic acid-binding protein
MYKQRIFTCPNCGITIQFSQDVEIRFSDLCPTCYFNWQRNGGSTDIKTCISETRADNKRTILND